MSKPLSSKGTAAILGIVALAVIGAGFAYFKPQFGPGPVVTPIPYGGPSGNEYKDDDAPIVGAGGPGRGAGAPIGAPVKR